MTSYIAWRICFFDGDLKQLYLLVVYVVGSDKVEIIIIVFLGHEIEM